VLALAACTRTQQEDEGVPEEEALPELLQLRDATVTLSPGHCAGVVVADGRHALTAAHCVDDTAGLPIQVVLRGGQALEGAVVLVDVERDVAVLRFEQVAPVQPLPVAAALPLPGDGLLFAGRHDRPGALQEVELRRLGQCPSLPGVPLALFTSLHGEKGDSGAPVVDRRLRVVGLVHGGAACSIATPTAELAPVLDVLVAEVPPAEGATATGGSGSGGR
jgi:S1-C subfamily serine protease